jgi:peroxiredoxin
VVVLGVDSGDTRGSAQRFLGAHGVTYPIAFDPGQKLALGAYAVPGLPVTYVINPAGKVVGSPVLGPVSDSGYSGEFNRELKAARTA